MLMSWAKKKKSSMSQEREKYILNSIKSYGDKIRDCYVEKVKPPVRLPKYDEAIFYLEEGIKKIPSEKYLRNDLMGVYETSAVKNVEK